jgi:WhiB family redox-sensing transcriptional regulator
MKLMNDFRLIDDRVDWMKDAKCAGVGNEGFFPQTGETYKALLACNFCRDCLVREECLEFSLTNQIRYGVWGGVSARMRQKLLAERKKKGIVGS